MIYRIKKNIRLDFKKTFLVALCICINLIVLSGKPVVDLIQISLGISQEISYGFLIPLYLLINYFYIYNGLTMIYNEFDNMYEFIFLRYNIKKWTIEKFVSIFIHTILVTSIFIIIILIALSIYNYSYSFKTVFNIFLVVLATKMSIQVITIILYKYLKNLSLLIIGIIMLIPLSFNINIYKYFSDNILVLFIINVFLVITLYFIFTSNRRNSNDKNSKYK